MVMNKLVIIPTYNEIENISSIIEAVFGLDYGFDILIIDDNSGDGTAACVKQMMEKHKNLYIIERAGKLGLGTAYIEGFKWALSHSYDQIFEMDADFSHNPKDLIRLSEACSSGADMAIGSRYVSGVNVINWPIERVLMSYFASYFVRQVTRMKIMDATAGFVCFSSKVLSTIDLDQVRMKGYGFQIEMKYSTHKLGFKIEEVPIIFTDRTQGTSKMSSSIFGEAFWGVLSLPLRKIKARG